MRHEPPFRIFNEIKKIGNIRMFDVESDDVIGLISARPLEWYASRAPFWKFNEIWKKRKVVTSSDSSPPGLSNDMRNMPPFWIFNEIQKKLKVMTSSDSALRGLSNEKRHVHHFEYLMRYEKSATSGGSTWKLMTSKVQINTKIRKFNTKKGEFPCEKGKLTRKKGNSLGKSGN